MYGDIITQFIVHLEEDEHDCVFQQDGACVHTAHQTIEFLCEFFGKRLISVPLWAPRSPDPTPLYFFLGGHLKNKVFEQPRANMAELKQQIQAEIAAITPLQLRRIFRNIVKWSKLCMKVEGGHFQHQL